MPRHNASHAGRPALARLSVMKGPAMKMYACARLSMRSTPKTRV